MQEEKYKEELLACIMENQLLYWMQQITSKKHGVLLNVYNNKLFCKADIIDSSDESDSTNQVEVDDMVTLLKNWFLNKYLEMDSKKREIDFVLYADNYKAAELPQCIFEEVDEDIRLMSNAWD